MRMFKIVTVQFRCVIGLLSVFASPYFLLEYGGTSSKQPYLHHTSDLMFPFGKRFECLAADTFYSLSNPPF